jgi:replicative DNA helicase
MLKNDLNTFYELSSDDRLSFTDKHQTSEKMNTNVAQLFSNEESVSDNEGQKKNSFASYGKDFQEKIVQSLLVDQQWAEQMLEVFNTSYFDLRYLQFLSDKYFAYAKKYKVFPTLQLLVSIIKDELRSANDIQLRNQIVDYLQRMQNNPNPGDLQYVKEKSLDFCRKQALKSALEEAVDLIATEKYEAIIDTIKKAVLTGQNHSLGHDFFKDVEARFIKMNRNTVPTGVDEIDAKEILNGGLGRGELGIIVAASGAGKSQWLTMLGANAMRLGKNVLHYTFELSETAIGIRYDSNLCEIDSTDIQDKKEEVLKKYSSMKNLGKLVIKEYPTNSATVYSLKSHVEKLIIKGFKPDVIIIDYADIMRSSRSFDSLRHELKLVYEELRAFSQELAVPIWTASQSNREGSNSEIIDMSNMSEAYGKAMVADFIITLSRKNTEKASGNCRLYIAKNRAGKDGVIFPAKINTARSQFKIISNSETVENYIEEEEKSMKKALKSKWKEMQHNF